jgi:hypothetical protein
MVNHQFQEQQKSPASLVATPGQPRSFVQQLVLSPFVPSLGGPLAIVREIAPALLAALASSLGSKLLVLGEAALLIRHALATLRGDVTLLLSSMLAKPRLLVSFGIFPSIC